jgi:hypothetical protein
MRTERNAGRRRELLRAVDVGDEAPPVDEDLRRRKVGQEHR